MTACKTHPDAPHGFDRNASHSLDRYVCECESWTPEVKENKMKIIEKTFVYEQDVDCCGDSNSYVNTLTVQTQDGGGGNYLVIKTDRWSIDRDDIGSFCEQLKSCLEGME